MASTSNIKTVSLDKPSDWLPWINIVRLIAQRGKVDVWNLIDPDLDTQPELPRKPARPEPKDLKAGAQTYSELSSDQKEEFKFLMAQFQDDRKDTEKSLDALSSINVHILQTISTRNKLYTRGSKTTWELLRNLKKRLAPTTQARRLEAIRAYSALKSYNKKTGMETYLYEWERIYQLCTALDLPDVKEERPLYDFAMAISHQDKAYATLLEGRIEDNILARVANPSTPILSILDVIENYRNHYRCHTR